MDIAIVTGAETPLGLSLIQRLVRQGYRVHGIGNNFSKVTFADSQFFAYPVDLTDLTAVSETMAKILGEEKSLDLLIHAIDVTPGAAFEKLPIGNLEAILKIGLLGPVMLTRIALPNLLRFRGQLINVIPANKSGTPASAVNALLEGGLREMNRAIFDSARDAGLRVTNLVLRQNPEPDALTVESSEQTHIDLEDVARAVEHLIDPNFANVPSELVLYPRSSAHTEKVLPELSLPLDPYGEVVLPPKAYCPPEQPKIPTQEKERVDRTIPYTDDEMEDKIAAAIEDFDAHPERYEQSRQSEGKPSQGGNDSGGHGDSSSQNKRRRGRRKGGRNRNRNPQAQSQGSLSQKEAVQLQPSSEGQDSQSNDSRNQPRPEQGSAMQEKSKRSSRRGRTKSQSKSPVDSPSKSEFKAKPSAPVTELKPGVSKKKPVKKTARSSSSSTEKKTAAKKIPVKKVAAKKAAKKTASKKAAKKTVKKIAKKAD